MATVEILLAEIAENIKSLADVSPLSASAILDLLKTVDGSGSGLDADTIKGNDILSTAWTNSSGGAEPTIKLQGNELLWHNTSGNNLYLVAGADLVNANWLYATTGGAIVINTVVSSGKIRFRYANLAGHAAGDNITWTVDTDLSTLVNLSDYALTSHTHTTTGATVTAGTGVTINHQSIVKVGGLVNITVKATLTANKTAGTVLFTLPSGYRPSTVLIIPIATIQTLTSVLQGNIDSTTGECTCGSNLSTGNIVLFSASYYVG